MSSTNSVSIRLATPEDAESIVAMLPMLASFPIAEDRNPDDLWQSDAKLVQRWARGEEPQVIVHVAACDATAKLAGICVTSLRAELLSGAPSAHLEALVVDPNFRRQRIGVRLIEATEMAAREGGAESISLHVFGSNERARALYGNVGYDEELIRARKRL